MRTETNKLDMYISLNLKMVTGNLVAMFFGNIVLELSQSYYSIGKDTLWFLLMVYGGVLLMEFIPLINALNKICYSSIFGRTAGMYNVLPVGKEIFTVGKVTAGGICCMMGLLPLTLLTPEMLEHYGVAYTLNDFLMSRGMLAPETIKFTMMNFVTLMMFLLALAAVILLIAVYSQGVKKQNKVVSAVLTAAGCLGAGALVSMPWILKVMSAGDAVTMATPAVSLMLAVAILVAASAGICKMTEGGVGYEG